MARYNYFKTLDDHRYRHLMDPSAVFIAWLETWEGEDGSSFGSTTFSRELERGSAEAHCLLDYLFVWLVEGNAKQYCPTYENWLLTIIMIVDQLQRGRFGARWTEVHGEDYVPQPGETYAPQEEPRHSRDVDAGWIKIARSDGVSQGIVDLPLLPSEIDLQHPALDRTYFERA